MKNFDFYMDDLNKFTEIGGIIYLPTSSGVITFAGLRAFVNWLQEEHQYLDDVEKQYLKNIIRPLKTENTRIGKTDYCGMCFERIVIRSLKDKSTEGDTGYIELPFFKKGTMYKGMENGKLYTLEELGL